MLQAIPSPIMREELVQKRDEPCSGRAICSKISANKLPSGMCGSNFIVSETPQQDETEVHHEERQISRIGDSHFFEVHKTIQTPANSVCIWFTFYSRFPDTEVEIQQFFKHINIISKIITRHDCPV